METIFEDLIKQMRSAAGILSAVASMFRDIWDNRIEGIQQKQALTKVYSTINKLMDRLVETTSSSMTGAYETRQEKLEA